MEKLYKALNRPLKRGLLGLEVEVEGVDIPKEDCGVWKYVKDGSLRGDSAEYVLKEPLSLLNTQEALVSLREHLAKSELQWSFRTSVHVHVNVGSLNYQQINCFIYSYILVEELMMKYCGDSRIGNRFCLRISDADGMVDALFRMFKSEWMLPERDSFRYAAINVDALAKFGSLEFRGMHGTLDQEVLQVWTEALVRIRSFSMKYKSPHAISQEFRTTPDDVWLAKMFGGRIAKALTANVHNVSELLSRSYSVSAMLSQFKYEEMK